MLAGVLFACATCGCRGVFHNGYHQTSYRTDATPESPPPTDSPKDLPKDPNYVTVDLDGDVRFYGPRKIKRELSKESVLEAAGGFAGLSASPPKSITLIRGGQKYVVPFVEMGQGKWKGFSLEEGDRVIVNWQLF
jgi:hypothetical protein